MKRTIIYLLLVFVLSSCANNKLTERVVNTYENGQPSKVLYYNRDGQCVREAYFYENGALQMAGDMENDLRNGEWISYFPDGKVQSSGFFKDGLRIGKAKVYFENGHLWMDGYYTDDHKCGEWIFYDEQGYEAARVNYGSCD